MMLPQLARGSSMFNGWGRRLLVEGKDGKRGSSGLRHFDEVKLGGT